jgi:hypothetical protein
VADPQTTREVTTLARPPLPLLLAALLALTACGGDPLDAPRTEGVDGVGVEVPDGWTATDDAEAEGVVAAQRWAPEDAGVEQLQVVVGCGGDLDELVDAALREPRGPLRVTAAEEDGAEQRVEGLDRARRLYLTFGAGRDDDAETIRTAALYGQTGEALLLVEYSEPAREFDRERADETLRSVTVEADRLREVCADQE